MTMHTESGERDEEYDLQAHLERSLKYGGPGARGERRKALAALDSLTYRLTTAEQERDDARRWFREAEGHRDYWKNREKKRTAALNDKLTASQAEVARLRETLGRIVEWWNNDQEWRGRTDTFDTLIEEGATALSTPGGSEG